MHSIWSKKTTTTTNDEHKNVVAKQSKKNWESYKCNELLHSTTSKHTNFYKHTLVDSSIRLLVSPVLHGQSNTISPATFYAKQSTQITSIAYKWVMPIFMFRNRWLLEMLKPNNLFNDRIYKTKKKKLKWTTHDCIQQWRQLAKIHRVFFGFIPNSVEIFAAQNSTYTYFSNQKKKINRNCVRASCELSFVLNCRFDEISCYDEYVNFFFFYSQFLVCPIRNFFVYLTLSLTFVEKFMCYDYLSDSN